MLRYWGSWHLFLAAIGAFWPHGLRGRVGKIEGEFALHSGGDWSIFGRRDTGEEWGR